MALSRRYWRTALAWLLAAPTAGFAVVRLCGAERGWPLVPLLAFTPYAVPAAAVVLAGALLLRRWWAAGAALAAGLVLAGCVLPRAIGDPAAVRSGPALRVVTANLRVGGADPAAIVALVRSSHADLLALQEYTWDARRALAAAGLSGLLPYVVDHPTGGVDGSALYARYPLVAGGFRAMPGDFGQAYATLLVPGAPQLLVESVHPAAPSEPGRLRYWRAGLADQPRASPHGPVRLLLGDFNATLDHAPLRALLGSGYRDAAATVGAGLVPSWPYDGKLLPKVTIDHVLVDPRIGVRAVSARRIPDTDHRALSAVLVLPPGGAAAR